MAKLTIHDIAKMANVSPSTVSFVLNDRPGICEETRRRVQNIIQQTGYTPNAHTRRLTLKRSFTIHVVMRQFSYDLFNLFGMDVLMGIFSEGRKLGYDIIFTSIDYSVPNYERSFYYVQETISSNAVDGVVFIQCAEPSVIRLLQEREIPFLCVDSHVEKDGSIPLVEVDYYDAAYRATNYLIQCGHRDIGFIGANANNEYHRMTFGGFNAALQDAGIPCHPEWVQTNSEVEHPTLSCMQNILTCKHRPTAVMCAGDIFAIEAIKQAQRAGFSVPQDLSFMSIDDLVVSEFVNPPLSTMSLDKAQMGRLAMQILYAMIRKEPYEPINLVMTKPVIRDSVSILK